MSSLQPSRPAPFPLSVLLALVALVGLAAGACTQAHSSSPCGDGAHTGTSAGAFCAYIVVEGGFQCPALAPAQIDIGALTVCAPSPMSPFDVPPQVCDVTGSDCRALLREQLGLPDAPEGAPARPPQSDPGDDSADVWIALTRPSLGYSEEERADVGFDLDGIDSRGPSPTNGCTPARLGAPIPTDRAGGVDNTFGSMFFHLLDLATPAVRDGVVQATLDGSGVLMLRLRGWNGQANDTLVDVAVTTSVDGTSASDTEAAAAVFVDGQAVTPSTSAPLAAPAWQGDDRFWVRDDGFSAPAANTVDEAGPLYRDAHAYVAGGILVLNLPALETTWQANIPGPGTPELSTRTARVRLTDSTFTLDLVAMSAAPAGAPTPATAGWRWSASDVLEFLDALAGVCEDPLVTLLETQLRGLLDERIGGPDPLTECNALSTGLEYDAYFANFAGIVEGASQSTCEPP